MDQVIAYFRGFHPQQGKSGLVIEAQKAAVGRFVEAEELEVLRELTEIESGKGSDALERRHQLAAALSAARKAKCPVLVAKLDRLAVMSISSRV